MKILIPFAVILLTVACSGRKLTEKQQQETALRKMVQYEDSVKMLSSNPDIAVQYSDKCLDFYRRFPDSKEAPKYLDRAHMILTSAGMNQRAVLYADTLIRRYPKYENRPMVLLSLATAYDMFLVPRNKQQAEKYYRMWLEENPQAPAEQRSDIEHRLKYINLSYDEMLSRQVPETSVK